MFAEVREHVDESISHFPRGFQRPSVPAVGPERASAAQELVDVTGDARLQPVDAGGEGTALRCLADEVQMVREDGEVDDAEAVRGLTRGAGDGDADRRVEDLAAQ